MRLNLKQGIVLALGCAVLLGAGVWWLRARTVETAYPLRGPAVDAVYATGTVEPEVMFPVAPKAPGRLMQLLADEGEDVAPGQPLAQLEDADLKANLAELQARETNAQATLARVRTLLASTAASQKDYDNARADVAVATQARKAAQAQLDYMRLVSPVSATVVSRDGEEGELIAANQAVFWLAGPGPLRITTQVDEEDIPRVAVGQEVLLRADAFPGQMFKGSVASITPKGDDVARSFRVRIHLAEGTPLRIGMTVEANIILAQRQDALLVPAASVVSNSVWLVKGGKLQHQPITVGVVGTSLTEVRAGVDAQSQVVAKPQKWFEPGGRVRARLSMPRG